MENDDDKMLFAAQYLRTLTSYKTEITISRRVTIKTGATKEEWDYLIIFGDIMNRGPWRWECAQAATLDATMKITSAQITAQGDEKAREFLQLTEAAAKLGLKLVEVTA